MCLQTILLKGMYVNLSRYSVSFEDHSFLDILSFTKIIHFIFYSLEHYSNLGIIQTVL